jgi:4-hydroxybutyryl-CoA dehydratase/vinylacetyl-CoA-Delta-isomerase
MAQMEYKKRLAKVLAGIEMEEDQHGLVEEIGGYFDRVFRIPKQKVEEELIA